MNKKEIMDRKIKVLEKLLKSNNLIKTLKEEQNSNKIILDPIIINNRKKVK